MLKAHPFKAVGMLQLYCYVERDRVSIKKKICQCQSMRQTGQNIIELYIQFNNKLQSIRRTNVVSI